LSYVRSCTTYSINTETHFQSPRSPAQTNIVHSSIEFIFSLAKASATEQVVAKMDSPHGSPFPSPKRRGKGRYKTEILFAKKKVKLRRSKSESEFFKNSWDYTIVDQKTATRRRRDLSRSKSKMYACRFLVNMLRM
jgi:hypothetical protein